jgi:hypothetical protein
MTNEDSEMKRISMSYLGVLLALIMVAFTLPAAALTEKFKFTGEQATASFDSTNGCIEDFVFVSGGEDSQSGIFVLIEYTQSDNCTQTVLMNGFGFAGGLPKSAVQISPNLDSVELNTSITVFDTALNANVPVTFSLTWTGTGNLSPETSHFFSHTPGSTIIGHASGRDRPAQASGNVTVNGANLTPEPSIDALISSSKGGELIVSH